MVCVGVGSTLNASVALAASAAAALTVAAAATEAVNAATESTLAALVRAGERLAAEGEAQFEAETTSRRWHMAASEAVGLNATVRLLAREARRVGVTVGLPELIALDGRSLDAVTALLLDAAPRVESARQRVADASVDAERRRLMSRLPIAADAPSVEEALRRYQETLVRSGRPAPADLSWVDDEVLVVLADMDADATAPDRDAALAAAGRVRAQDDEANAGAYLHALDRLVRKKINPRAVARRQAARWLDGLEHPVVADALAADPALPAAAVARELASVVADAAELSADLRGRAQAAVRWAAERAVLAYRADLLCTLLRERGFIVETGDGRLRVTRAAWTGEYTATIRLDRDGAVHHQLVGEARTGGDDAAVRDAELARAVADAVHDMTHDGVHGLFVQAHDVQYRHSAPEIVASGAVDAPRARRVGPGGRR